MANRDRAGTLPHLRRGGPAPSLQLRNPLSPMKKLRILALNALGRRVCVLIPVLGLLWPTASFAQGYLRTNLIVGGRLPPEVVAAKTDPNLVNPWGLARSTDGPWWVSNNGTGTT